jgi:L-iditol 2-dehydrogenase
MKALVKIKKGFGNVELVEIPEPKCKDDEIKIKIRAVGICGTDLHIYEGNFPYFNTPVILGHEFSGEIVEIGKNIQNKKKLCIKDRVVILPSAAVICGSCEYCKNGNFIFCPSRKGMGHGVNGGMTEYVCVREELVYKLPDSVSFEVGTLTEPLSCCVQSVDDFVNILPTHYCLVSGSGTIGLLVLSLLKLRNCKVILAGISRDKQRLEIGKEIGADLTINVEKEDIGENLYNKFGLRNFNVCFECSGVNESLKNCISYLKRMGFLIQVGLFGKDCLVDFNDIILKQLTVFGSLGFTWKSWDKSLELLVNDKLRLDRFITHKYKLDEWEEAFNKSKEADSVKVILDPT